MSSPAHHPPTTRLSYLDEHGLSIFEANYSDNVKLWLNEFEQFATYNNWPREQWPQIAASYLTETWQKWFATHIDTVGNDWRLFRRELSRSIGPPNRYELLIEQWEQFDHQPGESVYAHATRFHRALLNRLAEADRPRPLDRYLLVIYRKTRAVVEDVNSELGKALFCAFVSEDVFRLARLFPKVPMQNNANEAKSNKKNKKPSVLRWIKRLRRKSARSNPSRSTVASLPRSASLMTFVPVASVQLGPTSSSSATASSVSLPTTSLPSTPALSSGTTPHTPTLSDANKDQPWLHFSLPRPLRSPCLHISLSNASRKSSASTLHDLPPSTPTTPIRTGEMSRKFNDSPGQYDQMRAYAMRAHGRNYSTASMCTTDSERTCFDMEHTVYPISPRPGYFTPTLGQPYRAASHQPPESPISQHSMTTPVVKTSDHSTLEKRLSPQKKSGRLITRAASSFFEAVARVSRRN